MVEIKSARKLGETTCDICMELEKVAIEGSETIRDCRRALSLREKFDFNVGRLDLMLIGKVESIIK